MDDGQQLIDYLCHWDEPLKRHLVCSRFYFARARKEIIPNYKLGCWVMPSDPLRTSTFEQTQSSKQDHRGEDYRRVDCPFCGGPTPEVRKTEPRRLPRGDATGDGEL